MARRGKEALIQAVISPLAEAGWTITRLSPTGVHPARFTMRKAAVTRTIKLYIWNLSHGGRGRSDAEYRIQATGVKQFAPEPDGITLVMGWDDDLGVFAGFDVRARRERLGSSPSIQIMTRALEKAISAGAAVQPKREGEHAIAVRPDHLARYIDHLDAAHHGDLTEVLRDPLGDADDFKDAFDRLSGGDIDFDFSRPAEAALRAQVRERTNALLAILEPNTVPPGQIGHNGPPGPIEDDEPSLRTALEVVRAETGQSKPDGRKLARSGAFFAWLARGLQTMRDEAKAFGDKGKDLLREHLAKALGGAVGGVAWNARDDILSLLQSLMNVLLKWLELAAGLF